MQHATRPNPKEPNTKILESPYKNRTFHYFGNFLYPAKDIRIISIVILGENVSIPDFGTDFVSKIRLSLYYLKKSGMQLKYHKQAPNFQLKVQQRT